MAVGVTGKADPEDEVPWGMPIAFVVDKQNPASITAICEAAAKATVHVLSDPRAETDWKESIERWTAGRIRKVVRRGKRATFDRADHIPGVTLTHRGATVRAFMPMPTTPLPEDLKRLQVSGSEPPERGEPTEGALVSLWVNPALKDIMSVGKTAAQVSHASQLSLSCMDQTTREAWIKSGFSLRVVYPDASTWETLKRSAQVSITDAGFTEIPPGSNTVVATW